MTVPAWVHDAIVYTVMPDRLARGRPRGPVPWDESAFDAWDAPPTVHSYKGGDLWGVIEMLPHVRALGANTLYLLPVWPSPAYHRYKPLDFFSVDPVLGGEAAFDALIAAAHRTGLRVILDGVFNHVSWGFPPFLDVLENGERSPWRGWFLIDGFPLHPLDDASGRTPNYASWNGHRSMPRLNHGNPAVQELILRAVEAWIRRGVDGWRFDAPEHVGDEAFWRSVRARVSAVNPDAYLVGEIWPDASRWLDGTQWHGSTNYQLMFALQRFIGGGVIDPAAHVPGVTDMAPIDAAELARRMVASLHLDGAGRSAQLNFLGTADTPRLLTLLGGDLPALRMAELVLFTIPGVPCILYGDEVGLPGGRDPDNRRGFPAPQQWDRDTLEVYRRLTGLRTSHPALRTGTLEVLVAEGPVLAFSRTHEGTRLVTALNVAPSEARVHARALPHAATLIAGEGQLSASTLVLPPRGSGLFLGG